MSHREVTSRYCTIPLAFSLMDISFRRICLSCKHYERINQCQPESHPNGQHCQEKHLHRYVAEFDFRYNARTALGVTDAERSAMIVKGAEGKRRMYRLPEGLV